MNKKYNINITNNSGMLEAVIYKKGLFKKEVVGELTASTGNICILRTFYVLPEYRGKGVGKALFAKVVEMLKDIPGIDEIEMTATGSSFANYEPVSSNLKSAYDKEEYTEEDLLFEESLEIMEKLGFTSQTKSGFTKINYKL